jgi:hypothetical protein
MNRRRSSNVVLMSIHKAGTNLVGRLLESVGYTMVGPGFQESYRGLNKLWHAKGRPFRSWATSPDGLVQFILSEYPRGTGASVHRLSAASTRTASILKRRIPIIFNHRDPRDVMISEIYYIMRTPPPFESRRRESRLLKSMPSMAARLDHCLDAGADYFDGVFRQHEWLLEDPRILCVSYEQLVGPRGGGSRSVQLHTTRRVMDYLSVPGKRAATIASRLYSEGARTFRQGKIGSWREEFTPHLRRKFNRLHRDILNRYGYPER